MLNTPRPPQVGCTGSLPRAAARPRRARSGRRTLWSVLAVGALLIAAFPSAAAAAANLGVPAPECRCGRTAGRHRSQLVATDRQRCDSHRLPGNP